MKLQGFLKGSGKIGNIVTSTVAGQTIAREYQPNVSNPSTQAQVDQRAKLKLMSQIAAALAPVIAIPKEGLKSSRNLFIKKNFDAVSAVEGVAQITYENVQLTNGNAGIPAIELSRSAEAGISAQLAERCDAAITRVVYILYKKTSEATLQYVQSIIVDDAGMLGTFPGTLIYTEGDIVVFAYGMKDLNAKASAKYSNYNVRNGEDLAKLTLTRKLNMQDYQFTKTRGTTLFAGESESVPVGANQARVYVTAEGPGTVSGAGVFDLGQTATVHAVPNNGSRFRGWRMNGDEQVISTDADFSFEVDGTADLIATFYTPESYLLTITRQQAAGITVTVDGNTIESGANVDAGATVVLRGNTSSGDEPIARINNVSIIFQEDGGSYVGSFVMPSQASTLVINGE